MAATSAMQREAVALIVVTVLIVLIVSLLRLRAALALLALLGLLAAAAGDERGQALHVATFVTIVLRLPLRLMLLLLGKWLGIAWQIGLRLARAEWRFAVVRHRLLAEAAFVALIE